MIKNIISKIMRTILPESWWVAIKMRFRAALPKSAGPEPADDTNSGIISRLNARIVMLEGKLNMLVYGSPDKNAVAVRVLEKNERGGAAEKFFAERAARFGPETEAKFTDEFTKVAKYFINTTVESVLNLSQSPVPAGKLLHSLFPRARLEQLPTHPMNTLALVSERRFDMVLAIRMLEHLSPREQVEALKSACKIVSPNGVFYLRLPNLQNPVVMSDLVWQDPDFIRPFSLSLVEEILNDISGFRITRLDWHDLGKYAQQAIGKGIWPAISCLYVDYIVIRNAK